MAVGLRSILDSGSSNSKDSRQREPGSRFRFNGALRLHMSEPEKKPSAAGVSGICRAASMATAAPHEAAEGALFGLTAGCVASDARLTWSKPFLVAA